MGGTVSEHNPSLFNSHFPSESSITGVVDLLKYSLAVVGMAT